jgi:competence protein ComEA
MRIKQDIKAFLTFGKRDRIGIIAMILLIAVVYFFPYLFAKRSEAFPAKQTSVLIKAMDTLATKQNQDQYQKIYDENDNSNQYQPNQNKSFANGELFQFDPNTLSVEGLEKLGLSEKTSKTIDRYRTKGGKFYKPEDIKKIWGMPEGFYERVRAYIVIVSAPKNFERNSVEKTIYPERKNSVVNVSEADTSAFIALPGIGSKLAARIVSFRDKLGGFYSIDQIGETYGLPDSTFQKIRGLLHVSSLVKKLNINNATKDELKEHPYIKWNLANVIVEYRNQHGAFKNLEELKNIATIDEATFKKIAHYLTL